MKKTEKQKFKEWAREIQYALGLENWRLSYEYYEKDEQEGSRSCAASMHAQPEYMELALAIYPTFYKQTENHQFEILVHEFCHAFTEEIYRTAVAFSQGKNIHQDSLEQSCERNTTMIHLAVLTLMKNTKLENIYSKLKNIKTHK